MKITVWNQDRDQKRRIDTDKADFNTVPVLSPVNGKLLGFDLFTGSMMLGHFDSVEESIREINMIRDHAEPVYYVSGYYCDKDLIDEPETTIWGRFGA